MAVAGAAIASMLSVPACGDGEDTGTSVATSHFSQIPPLVSRSQFIDESHRLCKKWKVKINRGLNNLYRQRSSETGEVVGQIGAIEAMRVVVVPSMKLQVADFEALGFPKGEVYETEAMLQELRNIVRKIEDEGIVAWTRESLLDDYKAKAKRFQLQNCLYF